MWRDPHHCIEDGESWADVFVRVQAFFERLRVSPPARELILVTHGGTMNVAMSLVSGGTIDAFELAPLENCAVRTIALPLDAQTSHEVAAAPER